MTAAALGSGTLGEWDSTPGLRDARPPAAGEADQPPAGADVAAPPQGDSAVGLGADGGSTSARAPTGTSATRPDAAPATGEEPAAPPDEQPSATVTRQQVTFAVLPGPVHIDVTPQTLSIADARGSTYGWELSIANAAVGPLMAVHPQSALGVAAGRTRVGKDVTPGSYGSTGGAWVWQLDQADPTRGVTVTFRAPDCGTVTHTYPPAGGELHVAVA